MKKEKNNEEKKLKNKQEDINDYVDNNDDQILLLGNRIKELESKLLRNQAELINYKKRTETEVSRLLKYASEELIEEILPILDNFERAINKKDLNEELSKYLSGFEMIYEGLKNILNKFEVSEIISLDKEFDPTYHQAVMTEKKENTNPGIVIEVLQKGYMYKDKVIRPSMVKVSE